MPPMRTIDYLVGKLVPQENGCLIWPGAKTKKGYGTVKYRGKFWLIHRLLYTHFVGPIPEGLEMDHFHCDTPSCANWLHVRPATHLENAGRGDREAKGRHNREKTICKYGHPYTPENTRHEKVNGARKCRECVRARQRKVWRLKHWGSEEKPDANPE